MALTYMAWYACSICMSDSVHVWRVSAMLIVEEHVSEYTKSEMTN